MRTTTFLVEKENSFVKLKNFYDLSVMQTEGVISYINRDTKETIPAEIHELYIISFTGNFRDVAYGYTEKYKLKLLEAYQDYGDIKIHNEQLKELIKPVYEKLIGNIYQREFLLSNEFEGCQVYRLDYFLPKKKKIYWKFIRNEDEYIQRSIPYLKIISN